MLEIVEDPLEKGCLIAGKYRLERQLGEGGMGVVWAARELPDETPVALKFLRAGRESDPKNRARFLREARAAMAVSHPHVAKVRAVLETDAGTPFLVMDLLEGDSLRDILRRRGSLTLVECTRLFVPVVDAIAAAHALGIVHRDLKPENVFLVHGVDVRVLDFGIAKQLPTGPASDDTASASLTSTGALLGTPQYMAPEQIFADATLDGRADVWALGVMLYECIAGVRPFDAIGLGPLIKRITLDPIRPLADAAPGLPSSIYAIVDRMLSRSPEARPSLAEIRAALAPADVDTRREPLRLPERMIPHPHALPLSTTVGVAGQRPSVDPPSAPTSVGKPMVIAAAVVLGLTALGGAAALTFGRSWKGTRLVADGGPVVPPPSSIASTTAIVDPPEPPDMTDSSPVEVRADASSATPVAALDAADFEARARAASDKRDGKKCVDAYDARDRLVGDPAKLSTAPESPLAEKRARCMMLAGDCDGGKALFRRSRAARNHGSTEAQLDLSTDGVAADFCTGEHLSARDELRRADHRLREAAWGSRKATSAECLKWYDSVSRLSSSVQPRAPEDDIGSLRMMLIKNAPSCLARAGDCASSFRVYRDEVLRTRPGTAEKDIRGEYKALTDELRLCGGTP